MKKLLASAWNWVKTHPMLVGTAALVLLLDRVTKVAALVCLPRGAGVEIFPFFYLHYVENTGAAFGTLQNGNTWLIFIMLAIIGYILFSWKELASYGKLAQWGCMLILAGALGNFYDRITLGFVVDFLDFRVWPVFNVADSSITVGGCLLAISFLVHVKKKPTEEK